MGVKLERTSESPGVLVTTQPIEPTPEFAIQQALGEPKNVHF